MSGRDKRSDTPLLGAGDTEQDGNEGSKHSHLFVFSGLNKAGMQDADKKKQQQIIYEMSKDSSFFKQALKQDQTTEKRTAAMKKKFEELESNSVLRSKHEQLAVQKTIELEEKRDLNNICCVLDMDMFFAAVEIRDRPELKDKPVAVGGSSMISTSNYVARKFGVRAAMPGFIAKKLCPDLVFVNSNFDKYRAVSEQMRAIIAEYDPEYSSHSLDEIYFNLSAAARRRVQQSSISISSATNNSGNSSSSSNSNSNSSSSSSSSSSSTSLISAHTDVKDSDVGIRGNLPAIPIILLRQAAVAILHEIRARITATTGGLTCSAGIANNYFLAKIGADVNKPDGQFEVPPTRAAVMDFVSSLPIRKVGGIGKVTENMLQKLGMYSMSDVRSNIFKILYACTPSLSGFLARTSLGIGGEEVDRDKDHVEVPEGAVTRDSLSCERTFSALSDTHELCQKLHEICKHVSSDLKEENLWGRCITLKVKTTEFEVLNRSVTSKTYVQDASLIESLILPQLVALLPIKLRLLGVRVSKFRNALKSMSMDPKQPSVQQFFGKTQSPIAAAKGKTEKTVRIESVSDGDNCTEEERFERCSSAATSLTRTHTYIGNDKNAAAAAVHANASASASAIAAPLNNSLFISSADVTCIDLTLSQSQQSHSQASQRSQGGSQSHPKEMYRDNMKKGMGVEQEQEEKKEEEKEEEEEEEEEESGRGASSSDAFEEINCAAQQGGNWNTDDLWLTSDDEDSQIEVVNLPVDDICTICTSDSSGLPVVAPAAASTSTTTIDSPNKKNVKGSGSISISSHATITSSSLYTCPACCAAMSFHSLQDLNTHLDVCLGLVQQKQEHNYCTSSTSRSNSNSNGGDGSSLQQPSKKRKVEQQQQQQQYSSSASIQCGPSNSISQYFTTHI